MSKMTIMIGLQASGKSTKCKELVKQGNTVRVNWDLLREMMHFNKFTGINEGITQKVSRDIVRGLLTKGTNVVIDNCNLNPGTLQSWIDLAEECKAKIQYERIDTPVDECIRRDRIRREKGERFVGDHVIMGMAMQYGLWRTDLFVDAIDKEEKGVVISDLDGTLADCTHRLQYAKGDTKDWKKFFEGIPEDSVRNEVAVQVDEYRQAGHPIILVSARPEDHRETTEAWLRRYGIKYDTLLMRKSNDKRDDVEVKQEIYDKYLKKYKVEVWFDDRPKIVRMLRENGLNVVDVGPGIEF